MSKLRTKAILCTGGVLLMAATALVAFRPYALAAGEEDSARKSSENRTVVKKRWSLMSPFSLTRVTRKKESKAVASKRKKKTNKVQLISSEKVVKRQQSRKVKQTEARVNKARVKKTNHVANPSMRQPQRTYRPVRRVKKSFLTKSKDFFTSKIPGLRKKNTRSYRDVRYAQPKKQKTQPRNSGIRFASASKRKTNAPKSIPQQKSNTSQQSEVLQHLEKLYARDGLPMPEMDMKKMAQQRTADEDPLINNPFAKIASEMSQKKHNTVPKGDAKQPMYAGPLNDSIQKNAAGNPFVAFDRKNDQKGENPFKATKEDKKQVIELAEQKRVSPLIKHMKSRKKATPPESKKETAVGFQGYCPVALKDHRKKVAVDPKLVSVHEGTLYSFSTEQARKKFLGDPIRYAPVMGGTDMIPLIENGQTIEGSLEHCCWFRGRLYMFSSRETLKTFVNHPSRYATDIVR